MITIIAFKWRRQEQGHFLPHVCNYTAEHVNRWARMLRRNLTIPHKLLCITDDAAGITECATLPLWDLSPHGGCWHRLKLFDPSALPVPVSASIGDRYGWLDLDCVVIGNVDHIFGRPEPVVLNRYIHGKKPGQHYNGALCIMDRGAAPHVWNLYHKAPDEAAALMAKLNGRRWLVGSDQAWMTTTLGPDVATVGPECGVYEKNVIGNRLPADARLVFFSGARDPSMDQAEWVKGHYR